MAFVAPLIGVAIGGFAATAAGQALIGVALAVGTSLLAKRLQPKPTSNQAQGTSLSLRLEAGESREIPFGTCASAGSLKYHHSYGPNGNDYIQLVYQLADIECDGLAQVYVDGKLVTLGSVASGGQANGTTVVEYPGVMWIEFHSGAWGQAVDADLLARNASWTGRGRGVCYVRVTLKFDANKFPNGMPRFLCVFRGAKLYDWRLDSTNGGSGPHRWGTEGTYEWTDNPAVCLYNYRRGIFTNGIRLGGMSTPATSLPVAHWTAAANACDEDVDLNAGGTETRYRLGGIVQVASEHAGIIRDMLATMAGVEVDSGGVFRPIAGVAQSSVMTITDEDLIPDEPIEITPKLSRSTLINAVFGTVQDPAQLYESVALPPRISPADEAADGGAQLSTHYGLGMVQSGTQGQRVLEIFRRKGRFQRRVACRLRSRFGVLESGDWVTWTSARYGWTSAVFEVLQATLDRDMTVVVELREIAASIFAWTPAIDELDPDDPATVGAGGSTFTTVAGFDLATVEVEGAGGAARPGLRATWTPIDDATVIELRLEYRKVGDTVALERTILDPGAGEYTWLDGIQGEITYEARVMPITRPERTVSFTGWVAADNVTPDHIVGTALIAAEVPPDTITPEMLSAQTRFELSLMTAIENVMGSVSQHAAEVYRQAQQTAEASLASLLEGIQHGARISEERVERVTADGSLASLIETVEAGFEAGDAVNAAAVVTEASARASADSALASSIATVSSTVGGHTTSIASILTSIDGVHGQWAIQIDVDGNVVGLVRLDGGANESAFTVVADKFIVAQPGEAGGDPVPVFVISEVDGDLKLALRGDMILDGSILARHLAVLTLSAVSADIGECTAGVLRSADSDFIIDLDNKEIIITT